MNEDNKISKDTKKWIAILALVFIILLGFYLYNYFSYYFGKTGLEENFNTVINMLIIGQDNKESVENGEINSDSIMLVNLNPENSELNITVIPSNNVYDNKLLKEYSREELIDILGEHSGNIPNYYFVIDYEGFKNIVNLMSGIEVELNEDFKVPELGLYLSEGENLLSGQEALNYARFYNPNVNEMSRINRQQQVIQGFADKVFQKNTLLNIPKLYQTVMETVKSVETNLDYELAIRSYKYVNNTNDFKINYNILENIGEN
jgi:LCP family protein required for cell wall assembly